MYLRTCAAIPAGLLLLFHGLAQAQTCGNVASNVTTPTIDGFVESKGTCEEDNVPSPDSWIPNGGFAKKGSSSVVAEVGTAAAVTGQCTWKTITGWPPTCQVIGSELQTITKVTVGFTPPGTLTDNRYVYSQGPNGTVFRQSLDTRQAGTTTGPIPTNFQSVGVWTLSFQATINPTNCAIQPTVSEMVQRVVNVLECKPTWYIDAATGLQSHAPATTIKVFVPPQMSALLSGPARDAAGDWNTALSGTGLQLQIVEQDCGENGDCVIVSDTLAEPYCAKTQPGAMSSDGTTITKSAIQLPPDWDSRTAERLRRTMAHEFGHILGLGDYAPSTSCSFANSVMAPPQSCTSTDGMTLAPTADDLLPTKGSTYGNRVRKICGF